MYDNENNEQNINRPEGSTGYTGGSYSNTPGSTGYGNSTYNQNTYSANSTGTNSGNYSSTGNYGTTGNYGNTGNYNRGSYSNTGNYGNYQYSGYQQPVGGPVPPKKRGTGKKVAAVIAVALVLVLGLGAGYYSMNKIKDRIGATSDQADASESIKQQQEEKAQAKQAEEKDAAEADNKQEDTQEAADTTADSDAGISQTETTTITTVVTDVTDVVKAAMPAIVSINNNYTQSGNFFGQEYSESLTASGSGIIVGTNDTELLIATNYHVIEGADSLEVQFVDSTTAAAEVKGTNSEMDLAVIAVQLSNLSSDTKNEIAIAALGDSDSLVVGEPAVAIGNALGYGQSVTTGVISAVNRTIQVDDSSSSSNATFIQTDAAINPGNSGGALLNIKGEVIGINSNKIGGSTIEGMGYAIPISTAKPIIEALMTQKTQVKVDESERGYIGISGVSVTSEVSEMYGIPQGVYVASVTAGGGAEAAGLKEGDIIVSLDGQEISSMDDLKNRLAYYAAGNTVTLKVMRQSSEGYAGQDIQVTLGSASSIQTTDKNGSDQGTYEGNENSQDAIPNENNGGRQNPFGGFGFGFGN